MKRDIPYDPAVTCTTNLAPEGRESRVETMGGRARESRRVPSRDVAVPLTGAVCAALLLWGWRSRNEFYVNASFGLGYALGIVGLVMMVLLLGYSLRKRLRPLRAAGPVRAWFTIHMMLGLLGPVAILFHANFQLGSLNSSIALVCMLLVSGSGIVGRLIYPRIHHGMAGQCAMLRELRDILEQERIFLGSELAPESKLGLQLEAFEHDALSEGGTLQAAGNLLRLGPRARRIARSIRPRLDAGGQAALGVYLTEARRAAGFRFYERLFAWWHALHMPLCVMLFVAAAFHVLAVHMY